MIEALSEKGREGIKAGDSTGMAEVVDLAIGVDRDAAMIAGDVREETGMGESQTATEERAVVVIAMVSGTGKDLESSVSVFPRESS